MFPHGPGFVMVFDYMLSDLTEVIRNTERPLTEVYIYELSLMSELTINHTGTS